MSDPMRKEVSAVRKKIDAVSKELKPLGHICQKKVMARGRVHLIKDLICVSAVPEIDCVYHMPLRRESTRKRSRLSMRRTGRKYSSLTS